MEKYIHLVDTVTVDLKAKNVIVDKERVNQHASETIASKDRERRNLQIEAMIEIILELKRFKGLAQNSHENKSSGIVLNSEVVSSGDNFVNVNKVLGKGNSAGEVILMKDRVTDKNLAYKTIMLTEFDADEIRAWVSLADEEMAPELYHFRLNNNKVEFSMEPLPGQTLQEVIDNEKLFRQSDPRMAEKFALCVLDDLLGILQKLHDKQFVHRDIHGGNVILKDSMEIKLIDFGRARHMLSESLTVDEKIHSMKIDVVGIIRIFCVLFSGVDFNDTFDALKQLGTENLSQLKECMAHVPETSRKLLFKIMSELFNTVRDPNKEGFGNISQVAIDVKKQLPPDFMEIKRKVAAILFSDQFQIETDSARSQIGQTCSDGTDASKDNIPILDDPEMDKLIRNVTIRNIQMLDAAVSFF